MVLPFQRQVELEVAATELAVKLAIASIQLGQFSSLPSLTVSLNFPQIGYLEQFTEPLNLWGLIRVSLHLRALIRCVTRRLLRAERHQAGS